MEDLEFESKSKREVEEEVRIKLVRMKFLLLNLPRVDFENLTH